MKIKQALLKLAAPNMNSDESDENVDDELMPEFDILHALTGSMDMNYNITGTYTFCFTQYNSNRWINFV